MVSKLRYTVADIKVNMTGKKRTINIRKREYRGFQRERVIKKERE